MPVTVVKLSLSMKFFRCRRSYGFVVTLCLSNSSKFQPFLASNKSRNRQCALCHILVAHQGILANATFNFFIYDQTHCNDMIYIYIISLVVTHFHTNGNMYANKYTLCSSHTNAANLKCMLYFKS